MDRNRVYVTNGGLPSSMVTLLAVLSGISVANIYYCQPLLNLIRQDMVMSEFEVNLVTVATQIGYAIGLLLIVPLGDRYNRRTIVLSCFALLIAALVGFALSTGAHTLVAASLVIGICSVAPQIFMPFVSQYSRPQDKAKCVGYVLSGLLIGILTSRVVSGYVGDWIGWRSMYFIAAGLMLVSGVVVSRMFPYVEPSFKGNFAALMRSIFRLIKEHPSSMRYSVRSGLCFGAFLSLWACLAFRMADAPYHDGSDKVGLLAIFGIVGAMTAMRAGRYVPRLGVERMNLIGNLLMMAAWVVMALLSDRLWAIIAGIIVIDIGMQCVQLSNQNATMQLEPSASSRMNTVFMFTYFIGGALGTFLAGTMWSLMGWTGTALSGIGLIIIAMAITGVWKFCKVITN